MGTQQQKFWKILLIGDSCLDIYHYGECHRISPEAPVPVLKEISTESKMGMSSNVKLNLESHGLVVSHITNTNLIEKHRFVDTRFKHHMLRVDVGEDKILNEINLDNIHKNMEQFDVLIISDYDKGFLRHASIEKICNLFKDKPIFVDTKKTNLSCFKNTIIKVNEKEFSNIKKMPINSEIIVTLGDRGTLYKHNVFPVKKTDVFDVCGAGDVFLSALVKGFLEFGSLEKAISLANSCAAYSVSKMGTYVLTKEEINALH